MKWDERSTRSDSPNLEPEDGQVSESFDGGVVTGLSTSEESLLAAYVDGELGWWKRRRARRLLSASDHAQAYVVLLERTRGVLMERAQVIQSRQGLSPSESSELWGRIAAQLSQEEHARVLSRRGLSPRRHADGIEGAVGSSWWSRIQGQFIGGGVFGATVSAAVILFVVAPASQMSPQPESATGGDFAAYNPGANQSPSMTVSRGGSLFQGGAASGVAATNVSDSFRRNDIVSGQQVPRPQVPRIQPVSVSTEDTPSLSEAIAEALAERTRREAETRRRFMTFNRPVNSSSPAKRGLANDPDLRSDFSDVPRAIEVDWMRSKGRVRVFHDPAEKTAYIWVRPSRSQLSGSQLGGEVPRALGPQNMVPQAIGVAQNSSSSLSAQSFFGEVR